MSNNKKTWYEWILIWLGSWQLGKLISIILNNL
jgi:hypothetical protein